MKKLWLITLVILVGVPLLSSAKTKHIRGYEHSRGKEISVSEPLGWPVLVSGRSGNDYLDASIESLPGMSVIKIKPYNPWWRVQGALPATTTISVVGFPDNTKLHIYTRGYRDHAEGTTDKQGRLTLDVPTKEGQQFIIKAKPSTYHINIDTLFGPPGGDCDSIGTWNTSTKTCTLTTDVNRDGNRTIAIEDDSITLDGNGVTINIDKNGDGIAERTVVQKNEITASELGYKTNHDDGKITICHNASKNNPHTISIAKSAVKAHLAHGDKTGKCENERDDKDKGDNDKEDDGIDRDDQEHEDRGKDKKIEKHDKEDRDNDEEGKSSKIPPGQAKKKK